MEQHPIPQNVTTFQFRLIGDMTIKQFGYLAAGAIGAYICYKLPLPVIITWPLALFTGLLGIGLAFVPIEERPMDVWILSFIKSVYSPTVYVWQKSKQKEETKPNSSAIAPAVPPLALTSEVTKIREALTGVASSVTSQIHKAAVPAKETRPLLESVAPVVRPPEPVQPQSQMYAPPATGAQAASTAPPPSPITGFTPLWQQAGTTHNASPSPSPAAAAIYGEKAIVSKQHTGIFDWLLRLLMGKGKAQQKIQPNPGHASFGIKPGPDAEPLSNKGEQHHSAPKSEPSTELKKVQQETAVLTASVDKLKAELESKKTSEARVVELQRELVSTLSDKEKMEQELESLRRTVAETGKASGPMQVAPKAVATTHTPTVRIITPEAAPNVGLPRLTTFPNVVTGIIKDSDSNLLPGVLVTVRDKSGMPLRALKSNKLGQIAASTPLPNGTYVVEVEDPRDRYVFDRAQITLTGDVIPPIEITAKSQKEVMRSKLEKEIFGNQIK